jgi:soluble lytic murein transglycosylase-like protein
MNIPFFRFLRFGASSVASLSSSKLRTRSTFFAPMLAVLLLSSGDGLAQIERRLSADGVLEFSNRAPGKRALGKNAKQRPRRGNAVMPRPATAETRSRYDDTIREAARLYHLPEALIRAVIKVESNFDPRAVSRANAHGLMQMIPATAERMMVTDIFDPRQNILGGSRYLRVLANTFNGNLQLTVAGYNAGEGAVARYGGIPPYAETQAYVVKVLEYYHLYSGQ